MPADPTSLLQPQALRFWRRGELVTVDDVTPARTLLDLLRDDLRACDVKEGCAAGDCGACTVVVAEADAQGQLDYRAINSCIRPAHAIDGRALWTAADLAQPDGALHPVQQAMVNCHATQCGFCTPGFVMSLFALYQQTQASGTAPDDTTVHEAISGNLCRCTGYRAIVEAAHAMHALPPVAQPEAEIAQTLQAIAPRDNRRADYALPTALDELLQLRARRPQAQLIAGATDVGLWLTQNLRPLPQIIDLSRVAELRRVEDYPQHIAIGAAVPLQDAFAALAQERPRIADFARHFAGWPVRQSGTLGGNVANGSPIGDSMPLLIALGASVVLMAWRQGRIAHRELPLESLYTGYRQNVMRPDEVLAWIKVPRPTAHEWFDVYKVSKRAEDDISAVCLALRLDTVDGRLEAVRIGVGGVAATPARAWQTEAVLQGHANTDATWQGACAAITQEFQPLSDLRASADYRRALLGNLLERARRVRLAQDGHGAPLRLDELSWEDGV